MSVEEVRLRRQNSAASGGAHEASIPQPRQQSFSIYAPNAVMPDSMRCGVAS
jgi:hypothetical protein